MSLEVIKSITQGRCDQNVLIENETFDGIAFENFLINPCEDVEVRFKNCIFNECSIVKGSFQLCKNVVLESVVLKSFKANGDLDIHSGVRMINSKISSSDPTSMLWIRNILNDPGCSDNKIELDIKDFNGEVIITGNDVSKVNINDDKHLFISKQLLEQDRYTINRANFFRSSASKVKNSGSCVGVFSVPQRLKTSNELLEQLAYFRSMGYVSTSYR